MEKKVLITQDFFLYKALHHYIDSIKTYKDMDKLVNDINMDNDEVTYLFIVDNRYPFSESIKVESAIIHKNIKARFLVIQVSNLAHHVLGYSHYFHVRFEKNLYNMVSSILAFVAGEGGGEKNVINHSVISKIDIEILKYFIFGESVSSVASKMDMSEKKIYLYRELLYKKLGLHNFNQAFLYILKHHPDNSFNERKLKNARVN